MNKLAVFSAAIALPASYIGAHLLWDWGTTTNTDIVLLWKPNDTWYNTGSADGFCSAPLTTGGCNTNPNPNGNTGHSFFGWVSVDTANDPDSYHGSKMIDGPMVGKSFNFNVGSMAAPLPGCWVQACYAWRAWRNAKNRFEAPGRHAMWRYKNTGY